MLDSISVDNSSDEARENSEKALSKIVDNFDSTLAENPPSPPVDGVDFKAHGTNWFGQVLWVTHRSVINSMRNTQFLFMRAGQSIFTAVLLGLLYFQMGDDQTTINDRTGLLVGIPSQSFISTPPSYSCSFVFSLSQSLLIPSVYVSRSLDISLSLCLSVSLSLSLRSLCPSTFLSLLLLLLLLLTPLSKY